MKKIIISVVSCACLVFVLSSCKSSKEFVTSAIINGEWSIVEINGTAVVPTPGREYPSIGFDTSTGKIYGNSGCNRMMGSFDPAVKPGTIDLSNIATTKMFCPDMTIEQNVLNVLKNVKGYRILNNGKLALTNALNRPIVILNSKMDLSVLAALEGEWKITEVKGESIPQNMDKKPFLSFDTTKRSIHGNAGCNMINGGFTTNDKIEKSIAFPAVAATMMACPDMTIESKVLDALNEVNTYNILTDKSAGLYNQDGEMVLLLIR